MHTLFESGITRINDLERYIKDDVIRYGGRLSELEKKLANAYQEAVSPAILIRLLSLLTLSFQTTEEAWDDEALFRMEGDEEGEGEFVTYVVSSPCRYGALILSAQVAILRNRSARISSVSKSSV